MVRSEVCKLLVLLLPINGWLVGKMEISDRNYSMSTCGANLWAPAVLIIMNVLDNFENEIMWIGHIHTILCLLICIETCGNKITLFVSYILHMCLLNFSVSAPIQQCNNQKYWRILWKWKLAWITFLHHLAEGFLKKFKDERSVRRDICPAPLVILILMKVN